MMNSRPPTDEIRREVRELLSKGASNEQFKNSPALRKLVVSKLSDSESQSVDDWRLLRATLQDLLSNAHESYLRAACDYLGYAWTQKSYDEVYELIEKAHIEKIERRKTSAEDQERHMQHLLRTSAARRAVAGAELDAKTVRGVRNHDEKVASALADSLTDYCRDPRKIAATIASHPEITKSISDTQLQANPRRDLVEEKKNHRREKSQTIRNFGNIGTYIEEAHDFVNYNSISEKPSISSITSQISKLHDALSRGEYRTHSSDEALRVLVLAKRLIIERDLSGGKQQLEHIAAVVGHDHVLGAELLQVAREINQVKD